MMKPTNEQDVLSPLPDGRTARQVRDQHLESLLGIEKSQIKKIQVDAERAKELTVGTVASAKGLFDVSKLVLSPSVVGTFWNNITNLSEYATLYMCTEKLALLPWTTEQQQVFIDTSDTVRNADFTLTIWAGPCLGHIPAAAAALKIITPGRGSRDDASDTILLADLFRSNWDQKIGEPPFGLQELDQWGKAAVALLGMIGDPNFEPDDSPQNLKRRAYTLWAQTYNRILNVGQFLNEEFPERAQPFQGIHPKESPRPASAKVDLPDPAATPSP